jgi:hypothetical protein
MPHLARSSREPTRHPRPSAHRDLHAPVRRHLSSTASRTLTRSNQRKKGRDRREIGGTAVEFWRKFRQKTWREKACRSFEIDRGRMCSAGADLGHALSRCFVLLTIVTRATASWHRRSPRRLQRWSSKSKGWCRAPNMVFWKQSCNCPTGGRADTGPGGGNEREQFANHSDAVAILGLDANRRADCPGVRGTRRRADQNSVQQEAGREAWHGNGERFGSGLLSPQRSRWPSIFPAQRNPDSARPSSPPPPPPQSSITARCQASCIVPRLITGSLASCDHGRDTRFWLRCVSAAHGRYGTANQLRRHAAFNDRRLATLTVSPFFPFFCSLASLLTRSSSGATHALSYTSNPFSAAAHRRRVASTLPLLTTRQHRERGDCGTAKPPA